MDPNEEDPNEEDPNEEDSDEEDGEESSYLAPINSSSIPDDNEVCLLAYSIISQISI